MKTTKTPYGWVAYNPKTKKVYTSNGGWSESLTYLGVSVWPTSHELEYAFEGTQFKNIKAKPVYLSFK